MIVSTGRVVIRVDEENNAEKWWDSARGRSDVPACLRAVVLGDAQESETDSASAAIAYEWCAQIDGWNAGPSYASNALSFQASAEEG